MKVVENVEHVGKIAILQNDKFLSCVKSTTN